MSEIYRTGITDHLVRVLIEDYKAGRHGAGNNVSETSNRASNEAQATRRPWAKGIAMVLLVTTAIGSMLGVIFIGLMEWFPGLVLPHGGWEHVHWNLGGEFALKGGAVGLALGASITVVTVIRRVF